MNPLSTTVGLSLALGGPALIASFGNRLFGNSERLISKLIQQVILALLLILVIKIATCAIKIAN
jgi:hypothetical protein